MKLNGNSFTLKNRFRSIAGAPVAFKVLKMSVDPEGHPGFPVDSSWVPPHVSIEDACDVVAAFLNEFGTLTLQEDI